MILSDRWVFFRLTITKFFCWLFPLLFLFTISSTSWASAKEIYVLPKKAILLHGKSEVKIGVPYDFKERGIELPENGKCERVGGYSTICNAFSYGNAYQLLDWIENARIDGVYISSITLQLMKSFSPRNFSDRFYKYNIIKNKSYYVALYAEKNGLQLASPIASYDSLLNSLVKGQQDQNFKLRFKSHLDPALLSLYLKTKQWMQKNAKSITREQKEKFWNKLIANLEFGSESVKNTPLNRKQLTFSSGISPDCKSSNKWSCLDSERVKDYLVLRKQVSDAVPNKLLQIGNVSLSADEVKLENICHDVHQDELGLAPVCQFFNLNYKPYQYGAKIKRSFRFKIPELLDILRPIKLPGKISNDVNNRNDLALVLTGGGVKAAYQTYLIDYLYGTSNPNNRLLENLSSSNSAISANVNQKPPLKVNHVIGTSGGALLGLFVATHPPGSMVNYSNALWENEKDEGSDNYITSLDIFPAMDLMRWLSFVVCVIVFTLVASVFLHVPTIRKRFELDPEDSVKHIRVNMALELDEKSRFRSFSLVWMAFMFIVPWLVDYVNGNAFEEHIPAVQGIFYFIYIVFAVHTDNNIIRIKNARVIKDKKIPTKEKVIAVLALVLTFTPLLYTALSSSICDITSSSFFCTVTKQYLDHHWVFRNDSIHLMMTLPSLIIILGLLFVAWFMHYWYVERASYFSKLDDGKKGKVQSFLIIIIVALLTFGIMIILYNVRVVSLLELSLNFWGWQVLVSAIVSLLIIGAGISSLSPHKIRIFFEPKIRFLLLPHPAKTLFLPLSRVGRMVLIFTVTWGWWNIVIAPGLYGNYNGQMYLAGAWDKVSKKRNKDASVLDFQTFYVAPATSLENQLERYFLFSPTNTDSDNAGLLSLSYRNQLEISADTRWTQFAPAKIKKEQVLEIAFASGSPFPIFSAHKIKIPDIGSELLVDGGYAHNTPIEAATMLGAKRILVMSSSPLALDSNNASGWFKLKFGGMAENLPRLIPYFYSRSQIEDVLSADQIIVATIAPPKPSIGEDAWPGLTDFRQKTIKRMLDSAKKDINKRIGFVQSWGSPESNKM